MTFKRVFQVWVFSILSQQVSQFAQEEHGQGCAAAADRLLEFYLQDSPILSSLVVYFVNYLVTTPPLLCPGVVAGHRSSKLWQLKSPSLSRDLVELWGPLLHCAPWLFLLHSLDASSCCLVGSPGSPWFSRSVIFMTTRPKSGPDGCSAAVL